MQRVNGSHFYQLSTYVHPLTEIKSDQKIGDVVLLILQARPWLEFFLKDSIVPTKVCKPNARALLSAMSEVMPADFPKTVPNLDEQVGYRAFNIARESTAFETVLSAELQQIDTYFISKKSIYLTSDLIDAADMALDETTRKTISPEALRDFREAGKCLAFDLSTASGFHSMRATENVLQHWHRLVCKPPAKAKKPDMGECINDLRGHNADKGTIGVVDQIRELHRNPVIHPEIFLTVDEALRLFDIAKSAIGAMAEQITKVPPVAPTASGA